MNKQQSTRPPKYDQVHGPLITMPYEAAASQNFENLSGRWVVLNTSNQAAIASATDTAILGWAVTGDVTTSSTAGGTILVVNISHEAIYEMPLDAARTETQLKALIGETCDIVVTSNIQYADYDAASVNILEIMGYRYYGSTSGEQSLLVRLYLPNLTAKGGVV